MKKLLTSLMSLLLANYAYSQVGINTENPQQLFHTDGRLTTQTTNPTNGIPTTEQQIDDVVITNEGKVGIGTINPTEKLDVIGNVSIKPTQTGVSSIKFYESLNNGSNQIIVKAPENITNNRSFTLPSNTPINGFALLTDANGNTSWGAINASASTLASIALKGNPSVSTGAVAGTSLNYKFFQSFDDVVTDPNGVFNVATGTYRAAQSGNYLISAYIVPNASPRLNSNGYYYPVNLEVRKNSTPGNASSGENIMDSSTIRYASPGNSTMRYTVAVSGMVTLSEGDTLNLVVYLNGPNVSDTISSGMSFPSNFTYAAVADFKAMFSVTAL